MSDKLFSIGLIALGIWLISGAFADGTYYATLKLTGQSFENDTWMRLVYFIIGSIPIYIGIKSLFSDKI